VNQDIVIKALEIAAKYHQGITRKGTDFPYIVHPVEVALILQENGMESSVIAAGLLHDTLEDAALTADKLKELFGEEILQLVIGASEKPEDRENTLWYERKKHTIDYLKDAPLRVKYIICADKLSNVKSMIRDYQKMGDEIWDRFMNKDKKLNGKQYTREYKKKKQQWYYENIVKNLKELEGLKMYQELEEAVTELFK
jgi:(p)ppGpp synthase/HD superfamily hydrolase